MVFSRILPMFFGRSTPTQKVSRVSLGIREDDHVLQENLMGHVESLVKFPRHTGNQTGMDAAAKYIQGEWEKMGYEVYEQKFKGPSGDPTEYKNLIVSFGPRDAERIVLGAHYDVRCETPGADDNGSGIAGILETSRLLKKHNPKLTKRIDIVAYANEERPYFGTEYMGSMVHAKYLKENKIPVSGAVILEMIGYFSDEPGSQKVPAKLPGSLLKYANPSVGNFISVVGDSLTSFSLTRKVSGGIRRNSRIDVQAIPVPVSLVKDAARSDHLSYNKHGFSAVMVTDTANFRNPHYHEPTDLPKTLDRVRMAEVVKGVYKTIIKL